MIVVRKPAVHRWPAFSIVCRFPLIQFFLTSFSRKSLSHSNFCRKNIKVSAVLCLELFSSGCFFFSCLTCFFLGFFYIYHGSIVNIESFLFAIIINHLPLFVYPVFFIITIITEIQDILQQNMALCRLVSTLNWFFFSGFVSYRSVCYRCKNTHCNNFTNHCHVFLFWPLHCCCKVKKLNKILRKYAYPSIW